MKNWFDVKIKKQICTDVSLVAQRRKHTETVAHKSFVNKSLHKNFGKFTGKPLCQAWGYNFIKKRDPDTGIFLWVFRNFLEDLFYKTPPVFAWVYMFLNQTYCYRNRNHELFTYISEQTL